MSRVTKATEAWSEGNAQPLMVCFGTEIRSVVDTVGHHRDENSTALPGKGFAFCRSPNRRLVVSTCYAVEVL